MATIVTAGEDFEVRNISLNQSTDTAVDFTHKVISMVVKCRTAVDVQIRRTNNASDYFTIPANQSLTLDSMVRDQQNIAFWARSSSGNVVLEVIGTY